MNPKATKPFALISAFAGSLFLITAAMIFSESPDDVLVGVLSGIWLGAGVNLLLSKDDE